MRFSLAVALPVPGCAPILGRVNIGGESAGHDGRTPRRPHRDLVLAHVHGSDELTDSDVRSAISAIWGAYLVRTMIYWILGMASFWTTRVGPIWRKARWR